jgi:sortase A
VAAPLPTLPAAPPPPTTLPDFTSGGGGGGGGGLGRIQIPKLGINAGLRSGIDMGTLNQGPGHWPGTAMPGQPGNVVIAGHRTSHGGIFRYINSLSAGDQIILSNGSGDHVYVVTGVQIVPPTATWIIGQGGGSRVTLFACHPPGSTAQRIVVFGRLAG